MLHQNYGLNNEILIHTYLRPEKDCTQSKDAMQIESKDDFFGNFEKIRGFGFFIQIEGKTLFFIYFLFGVSVFLCSINFTARA